MNEAIQESVYNPNRAPIRASGTRKCAFLAQVEAMMTKYAFFNEEKIKLYRFLPLLLN
jgi:hypothetical protein